MFSRNGGVSILCVLIVFAFPVLAVAETTEKTAPAFSDEAFLDAAYNNCATVENRSAQSCACERKLIGDRVNQDDKQMAFLYWTNKKVFVEKFEARRKADPTWQKGFSERFSNLQAVIFAACGV